MDLARLQRAGDPPWDPGRWRRIFGDRTVAGTGDDLLSLLGQPDVPPPLLDILAWLPISSGVPDGPPSD